MVRPDDPARAAELRANALRAANGRSQFSRQPRLTWLWEWAKMFPAAVFVFLVMRTFFVEAYRIPSGSMEQTLLVGDYLLVNKLVFGATLPFTNRRTPAIRSPRHGDVVIFAFPVDPSTNFVKRLMGLPGDTVSMRDGVLVRNGRPVTEQYVLHTEPGVDPVNEEFRWQRSHLTKTAAAASAPAISDSSDSADVRARLGYRPSRNNWGPLVVPPGHFFVLGDNRDNSLDSRYWGFVADSAVRGSPLFVYYSFRPDSTAAVPWLTQIRWSRLGTVVH